MDNFQAGLGMDDGAGLRVVSARFLNEQKFDWDLFRGYDSLRVLTYFDCPHLLALDVPDFVV